MNNGKDFLTVKQLMTLMGTSYYTSAWKKHKSIREAIRPGKKALTIQEYCDFEGCDIIEIKRIIHQRDAS